MKEKSRESILEKQKKILAIIKTFPLERIDKITEDNFSFNKLTKQESYLFMECVWITLGKEQATNKELKKGIKEVLALFILEFLRRNKLVKINKIGCFERTNLGEEVKEYLKCQKK